MLSRIANNLYWAGRYLERIEHTARFVPVNYFAGLDGPDSMNLDYTLDTLNAMAGNNITKTFSDRGVLENIGFDKNNSNSLISLVTNLRENLRGARDLVSTELWQSVNGLYHFIHDYDVDLYLSTNLQEFMVAVMDKVAICKARIASSLIRNEVWHILEIGMQLECSFQILRIIDIKLQDINDHTSEQEMLVQLYELGNLMKSLESFDMNRKFYKKAVNVHTALEFLLQSEKFPRSLCFCVNQISFHLDELGIDKKGKSKSAIFIAEKIKTELKFTSREELVEETRPLITSYLDQIGQLNNMLVKNYFIN